MDSVVSPARDCTISVRGRELKGILGIPEDCRGIVLFAHGSGSSRFSPRNKFVADALRRHGIGTLLVDLLTDEEARDRANVFDIALLAERLLDTTEWLCRMPEITSLPLGYFGASTGAGAALAAAAASALPISAIVSRGGRPDLAGRALGRVRAATLLIVGSEDADVLELNRLALDELRCEKRLSIVAGATHLFEEPGTLEAVVDLAGHWFRVHFGTPRLPYHLREPDVSSDRGRPCSVQAASLW